MRFVALLFATATATAALVAAREQYSHVQMLCLVNRERARKGLKPLGLDAKLTKAAQGHSDYQARTRKMSHTGAGGSSPSKRISQAGYNWKSSGENVAYGYKSMAEVMKTWMNSPGHRANILGKQFTHFGSAVAYSGSTPYYTQNFGSNGQPATNIPKCDGSDSAYGGGAGNAGDYGDDYGDDYGSGGNDYGSGGDDYSSGGRGGRGGNDYGSGGRGGRGGNDYGNDYGSDGNDYGSGGRGGRGGNDYGSGQGGRGGRGGNRGGRGGRGGSRGGNDYPMEQGGNDYPSGGGRGGRGGKDKDCDKNGGGRGGRRGGSSPY